MITNIGDGYIEVKCRCGESYCEIEDPTAEVECDECGRLWEVHASPRGYSEPEDDG